MPSIFDFNYKDLEQYCVNNNEKAFRAKQVFDWVYKKNVDSFDDFNNVKNDFIEILKTDLDYNPLKLLYNEISHDGTVKFLFELSDKNVIETVLMRQAYGNSVCVTTQVGCAMGCSFCASGLLGKKRNLSTGEIVAQIFMVQKYLNESNERVSHVVVMGIGEPFDNYKNVMNFIRIINDPKSFEIGARHITVSTIGVVPKINTFAHEGIQVNLAISLHAPNDEIRSKIMKINKKYPIKDIIEAVKKYIDVTNRRITFEYILLHNVNDAEEHAHELSDLIRGLNAYVNLIPYNEVYELKYKTTPKEKALKFYDILKKRGINVTLRKEHGSDINAACGQLRHKEITKGK